MLEKNQKENKRGLSSYFMNCLKEDGLLHSLLTRVKCDPTLCLEIRQNYLNIYYRGGNLVKIEEKGCYIASFDTDYGISDDRLPKKELCVKDDVQRWVDVIPYLKQAMDFWFGVHPKEEREFQQLVVRENNGSIIGNSTDYFIIDIEYDNHSGARFDLIAVEWESVGTVRKLQKEYKPKLCFVEMKYGDGALSGDSGVLSHIKDFKKYVDTNGLKAIKEEMKGIFSQKRELGLIPALKDNKNALKEFSGEVDLLFLFANHDPASRKLKDILDQINEEYHNEKLGFNIKFCCSTFMGYGIYKQNVYSMSDFMNRLGQQISCS